MVPVIFISKVYDQLLRGLQIFTILLIDTCYVSLRTILIYAGLLATSIVIAMCEEPILLWTEQEWELQCEWYW